jgi:hypothetical protein
MAGQGEFKVAMDGRWDIDDLSAFAEAFRQIYALFYAVLPETEKDRDAVKLLFTQHFWSGQAESPWFAEQIYWHVPIANRLDIKSINYASPGAIELLGAMSVLSAISLLVRSYAKTGIVVIELLERIGKFIKERRLQRPPRNFTVETLHRVEPRITGIGQPPDVTRPSADSRTRSISSADLDQSAPCCKRCAKRWASHRSRWIT